MIYILSPYSHPDDAVQHERFLAVRKFTAGLLKQGQCVFSPIVYCREMALVFDFPHDAAFWEAMNTAFLRRSESAILLKLSGWEQSKGVAKELDLCKALHIQVLVSSPAPTAG